MMFDELCKSFDRNRPAEPPAKRTPWFKAEWKNGGDSINDLLRRFLFEHGYEYINTYTGNVWFLHQGSWCRCDYESTGDTVQFFLCEFIQN